MAGFDASPEDMLSRYLRQHMQKPSDAEDSRDRLEKEAERIQNWYKNLSDYSLPDSHKDAADYPSMRHYLHTYFSNNYDSFHAALSRGDFRLSEAHPELKLNPFVSTCENDALHAWKYAFQQKGTTSYMHDSIRRSPCYLPEDAGKKEDSQDYLMPRNRHVGEVYALVHFPHELKEATCMNVWGEQMRFDLKVDTRIFEEREFAFLGYVERDKIRLRWSASWPSFIGEWHDDVQRHFVPKCAVA